VAQYADPNNASLSVETHKGALSRASWLLILAAVVSVVFAGLFWLEASQADANTASLNTKISQEEVQLNTLKSVSSTISSLDKEGTNLATVFGTQKRWEQVLYNVQAHLYRRMLVTSLSVTSTGSVNLSGVTDTYDSYAALYSSLTQGTASQYFTQVKPVSVAKASNTNNQYADLPADIITFTFSLQLTPQMFTAQTSQ